MCLSSTGCLKKTASTLDIAQQLSMIRSHSPTAAVVLLVTPTVAQTLIWSLVKRIQLLGGLLEISCVRFCLSSRDFYWNSLGLPICLLTWHTTFDPSSIWNAFICASLFRRVKWNCKIITLSQQGSKVCFTYSSDPTIIVRWEHHVCYFYDNNVK